LLYLMLRYDPLHILVTCEGKKEAVSYENE
jgi:hypothetical protein